MFAVIVTFKLKAGTQPRFWSLICENAAQSLRDEAGCYQFDVATDPAREDEVLLYELYSNAEAFAEHLKTPHYAFFEAAAASMIADKQVRTYSKVIQ